MTNNEYKVSVFLKSLHHFLNGDLELFERICHEAELNEQGKRSYNLKDGTTGYYREKSDLIAKHGTSGNVASTSSRGEHGTSGNVASTSSRGNHGTSGNMPSSKEKEESDKNDNSVIIFTQKELVGSMYAEPFPEIIYRSTIPHVLAVLSAIDILGYLISDLESPDQTGNNIEFFLKGKVENKDELNCLIFLFRHGMSHSFFPKNAVAIKAHSTNPDSSLFFVDTNNVLTLNANFLIKIMIEKFDSIIEDEMLLPKMEKQFAKLEEIDAKRLATKFQLDLEEFKKGLPRLSSVSK